ncbi:MAG: putative acyl-CoA dehydrogenase YdbM [Luteibacter sp.]|uniref:acyl-CoA dehydrogenase family protein n=1 Tax=Luteibacter sp. TaxID=1886636 RepID=UPI0013844B48|nr:acyl-CoA dehydrogenase family protein [Luteibacter sp.]KAF1006175.1 MAG: putative acyl-CoA dehydrogenase YdbM [Luteibacter sp.]
MFDPDETSLAVLRRSLAATAATHDVQGGFPKDNIARLHERGVLGLTVPIRHGGSGRGLADAARVVGAVGGGESATGLLLAMHYVMLAVLQSTDSVAYAELARRAVVDGAVLNALQAEPDMGSAARGGLPATIARATDDGGWRIDGIKAWATGSGVVDTWLVLARTDEAERSRVGLWLVPSDSEGIDIDPSWNHIGLRASASHTLRLDGVRVSADACLAMHEPGSADARRQSSVIQVWNGVLLAALYDGVARAGRDWLLRFLNDRVPSGLGASLATVPRIQSVVGEIESLLTVNRVMIDDASRHADSDGGLSPQHARLVKMVVTENAVTALDLALSVSGNHGLDRSNPLERHFRDALCGRVHGPQSDTVLSALGLAALGDPALRKADDTP